MYRFPYDVVWRNESEHVRMEQVGNDVVCQVYRKDEWVTWYPTERIVRIPIDDLIHISRQYHNRKMELRELERQWEQGYDNSEQINKRCNALRKQLGVLESELHDIADETISHIYESAHGLLRRAAFLF